VVFELNKKHLRALPLVRAFVFLDSRKGVEDLRTAPPKLRAKPLRSPVVERRARKVPAFAELVHCQMHYGSRCFRIFRLCGWACLSGPTRLAVRWRWHWQNPTLGLGQHMKLQKETRDHASASAAPVVDWVSFGFHNAAGARRRAWVTNGTAAARYKGGVLSNFLHGAVSGCCRRARPRRRVMPSRDYFEGPGLRRGTIVTTTVDGVPSDSTHHKLCVLSSFFSDSSER